MAAGNFSATLREQEPTVKKADVAHSPLAQGRWEPAAVLRSFAAALSQRSGLLLNRQAAGCSPVKARRVCRGIRISAKL